MRVLTLSVKKCFGRALCRPHEWRPSEGAVWRGTVYISPDERKSPAAAGARGTPSAVSTVIHCLVWTLIRPAGPVNWLIYGRAALALWHLQKLSCTLMRANCRSSTDVEFDLSGKHTHGHKHTRWLFSKHTSVQHLHQEALFHTHLMGLLNQQMVWSTCALLLFFSFFIFFSQDLSSHVPTQLFALRLPLPACGYTSDRSVSRHSLLRGSTAAYFIDLLLLVSILNFMRWQIEFSPCTQKRRAYEWSAGWGTEKSKTTLLYVKNEKPLWWHGYAD